MNLIIDIGNATVKMAVMDIDNSQIDYTRTVDINSKWINEVIEHYNISSSIWITTRKIDSETENYLSSITPYSVHFIPGITPVPIVNCYDMPSQLGADRLALAIGAHNRLPNKNCLIFDFGTALTVDYIDASGKFLGGSISPGLQMRFASLHEHTSALPLIESDNMSVNNDEFPSNTFDAISRGVFNSMLYEIDGYLRKYNGAEIVFSGYDAKYFVDKFKITIFAQYDILLFEGLNSVLENCKIVSDSPIEFL